MTDDAELLRRYAELRSEVDFTEVVRRNLSLVYYAALRRTGGRADLAEEVSQYVFTALARNAKALAKHEVLAVRHTGDRNREFGPGARREGGRTKIS